MSTPVVGIPVKELLRKAQEDVAPKVAVVRGLRSYECEHVNWAVDQVVRGLRTMAPELAVADVMLPSFKILSSVSNDPEDTMFAPDDQLPLILESLHRSDVVLFASREALGLPDANTVRLIERLADRADDNREPGGSPKPFFDGKVAGVVVYGGCAAHSAALALGGAVNKLGATLVRHGLASWDRKRGDLYKAQDFAATLGHMSRDIMDLARASR